VPEGLRAVSPPSTNLVLGCDDNVVWSGYFQWADDRLGNLFDFGTGSTLSRVGFTHYGWGNAGPYDYDIEIWDPASCTFVAALNGLVAADAASTLGYEEVDMCQSGIVLSGNMVVTIDPNTCFSPTNCYPDLMFDDQLGVQCPVIINNATTAPACYDMSAYNGPFLLRIDVNNCPVPARHPSWGQLKSTYR
jgi:hypothetical protein